MAVMMAAASSMIVCRARSRNSRPTITGGNTM